MPGNSIGQALTVTTFGESHGPAIGAVIDGCPPGLDFDLELVKADLARRRPGSGKAVTQRKEADEPEILSGVFEGQTTGTPIGILIGNSDARPKDYEAIRQVFRPGHADYTYWQKYGIRDHRGSGRASARETACRVAAGAVAKMILRALCGAKVRACLIQMGDIQLRIDDWEEVGRNPFFAAEAGCSERLHAEIDKLRSERDSCGAMIRAEACGVPPGLGEPVFGRLDADLAHALMSINAAKSVEIGSGSAAAGQRGSEHSDEMTAMGTFASNNAGGVLGGISTGQDIVARVAFKPTSSIAQARRSVDVEGQPAEVATKGRHDPCVGLRAVPIVEAMVALVLADHLLRHRAQTGLLGGHHQ